MSVDDKKSEKQLKYFFDQFFLSQSVILIFVTIEWLKEAKHPVAALLWVLLLTAVNLVCSIVIAKRSD